jgi:hypothetical protein
MFFRLLYQFYSNDRKIESFDNEGTTKNPVHPVNPVKIYVIWEQHPKKVNPDRSYKLSFMEPGTTKFWRRLSVYWKFGERAGFKAAKIDSRQFSP